MFSFLYGLWIVGVLVMGVIKLVKYREVTDTDAPIFKEIFFWPYYVFKG